MGTVMAQADRSVKPVSSRRLLTAVPATAHIARELVKEFCEVWGIPEETSYYATLVMSELVTNAIESSQKIQELRPPLAVGFGAEIDESGNLVCWSWDTSPDMPTLEEPEDLEEHGRGLQVIQNLCGPGNFGVITPVGIGKTVWGRIILRG
jgi:anti-sigma regulatory factor (Ser/Thr protein kinase)